MKTKITLALSLFFATLGTLRSQTLEEALKTILARFEAAKTEQEMIASSSQMDMIAGKWSKEWTGSFYSAYTKIKISFRLSDKAKRDLYLDAADAHLEKAAKLSPDNKEVLILQAWSTKARIAIDGQGRWKAYGEKYDLYIEKAKKLDPENPRIFFLEGQGPFYKPKMWGGGKDKAKPYFEKAKQLFAQEDKSSILVPSWGEKENEDYLKQCEE